jgi:hypothetical protein
MEHANFHMRGGRRVCVRIAADGKGGFRFFVDKWQIGRGWQGYMPISASVFCRMMRLRDGS